MIDSEGATELELVNTPENRCHWPKGGESQIFNEDISERKIFSKFFKDAFGQTKQELMTKNQEEIDRRNDEIAVNQEISNNENEQREVRERAREKVEERQNEADLEQQNEKLREGLPLREQVLEIFKNYGFTLLATGVTIGAAISALFNPLKEVDKGIGKGLQTMSEKIGLICAIVSFIFKAEHTWLTILAVICFLMERFLKRNR